MSENDIPREITDIGRFNLISSYGISCHVDNIHPIPLTPEILKKNGFMHFHPENKKAEYWQIYVKDGDINVRITYGHFRFFITGKPIQKEAYRPTFNGHLIYVHELQHALRLCGIDKEITI